MLFRSLDQGRTLAVVGESGCGKSTLARQVTMIERPTSGRLSIAGKDVATADAVALIALALVAGLEDQIVALDGDPDVAAGIPIAPFEEQAAIILIEAALAVEEVAIEALEDVQNVAFGDDARHVGGHGRRGLTGEVLSRDSELAIGVLHLANHLILAVGPGAVRQQNDSNIGIEIDPQ